MFGLPEGFLSGFIILLQPYLERDLRLPIMTIYGTMQLAFTMVPGLGYTLMVSRLPPHLQGLFVMQQAVLQ